MKSYLEVKVPIEYNAPWFQELRNKMDEHHISVRWQNGFHHITVVFINEESATTNLGSLFGRCLEGHVAPNLTFDKVDVFAISSGRYIVYLTAEHPSEEFMALVKDVRDAVKKTGCDFDDNFRLHVTLGRVFDENVGLEQLRGITNTIAVPSFTLRLPDVRYMEYRFRELATWTMLSTE